MGKKLTGQISALAVGIAGMAVFAAAVPAGAGVITIGNGAGGTNATGLLGTGDPNLIGNSGNISIYLNGSGSVSKDVLLALLVPNDSSDLFASTNPLGTIESYANYSAYPKGAITGSSAFVGTGFNLGTGSAHYKSNGFWGDYSPLNQFAPSGKNAGFLGTAFNNSNSGTNFVGFDSNLNPSIAASDYGVYTFLITTNEALSSGGLINIEIPNGLPVGSILAAYSDNGDSTVWTNDGGVNTLFPTPYPAGGPLPIPATLPLTAAGGLGLLAFALRKRKATV